MTTYCMYNRGSSFQLSQLALCFKHNFDLCLGHNFTHKKLASILTKTSVKKSILLQNSYIIHYRYSYSIHAKDMEEVKKQRGRANHVTINSSSASLSTASSDLEKNREKTDSVLQSTMTCLC